MNQPQPFVRFTDHNLMDFAAGLGMGLNLPKTSRIREIEAQEGNAFIAYPFGFYQLSGDWFSRFANDNDWQQTGPCRLAPLQRIPDLSKFENMAVNYLKAVISIIVDSDDATIITTNATGILPAGLPYTLNAIDYTADLFEVALINTTGLRDVHLLGEKQYGQWKVQMFIATEPTAITDLYDIYITAMNATLPLEVDMNGFTFQSVFLDLDFCDFSAPPLQEYFLPAKQGDVFQINIPVEGTNLPENGELFVKLVDCKGDDLPMQSEIVWPEDNCISMVMPYQITGGVEPEYISWGTFAADLDKDLVFWYANQTANYTGVTANLQTSESLLDEIITLPANTVTTTDPQDFIDAVAALDWPDGIAVSGEVFMDGENERVRLFFCFDSCPEGFNAIQAGIFFEGSALYSYYAFQESLTATFQFPTQYQASLTIPFTLPDGTYKIAITDNYTGAVYCFSNIIQVDSTDEFSQIIQFQGNNIAEGFEYFNGWFQQIRMGINGAGPEFENQVSVYRDSNGNSRSTSVRTDLILNLHTDWIDDETLKALQSATNHRTFNVGTQSLYVTDFEVSHNQDFSTITSYFGLAQVKIKAKKQNYQPINQGCVNC
jgi:phage gp46-like protein